MHKTKVSYVEQQEMVRTDMLRAPLTLSRSYLTKKKTDQRLELTISLFSLTLGFTEG